MGIDWNIQTHDQLESTQNTCFEAARNGAQQGTVIRAIKQVAGKGRHGRVWETGDGNLAFSCLLKPQCEVQNVGQLAIVVGTALADTFKGYTDAQVNLKWPNDVFIDGKKCAGILIESELSAKQDLEFAVIGVGVNIAVAPEYAHALSDYCNQPIDIEAFLAQVLENIEARYTVWEEGGFEKIRSAWNALSLQEIDENGHLIEGDVRHAAGH
ncbi:MAG: biotin--[acetyl-CoA-carboxylase] ligase [Alphaproteobacteria bacterium]|nr:biotin--[acetyl-CoA-carboxylase] ligase [Alphaproteobacteria bacterium]